MRTTLILDETLVEKTKRLTDSLKRRQSSTQVCTR